MKFILHTSVWGKYHTDTYLKYSLSSILGQLSLIKHTENLSFQYNLFTTKESYEEIISNTNFIELNKIINIKINTNILSNKLKSDNNFQELNNFCISNTLSEVLSEDAAFCWIIPDVIHANNFFDKIVETYSSGKRILLAPSHTRCCEEVLHILLKNFSNEKKYISISSRDLTKISFNYICKISAYKNYYNYYNPTADQQIYYYYKGNYICHATSPAPVFIYPKNKNVDLSYRGISFEGSEILQQMVPNFEDIEIIKNTSYLNNISVEREKMKDGNLKILSRKNKYKFFNRPFFINFLSYLLLHKHSYYAIKYFQEPIMHIMQDGNNNMNEIKSQKPSLFICNVTNTYLRYSHSKIFRFSILILYKALRLILRFRRKFFIKEKVLNANATQVQ